MIGTLRKTANSCRVNRPFKSPVVKVSSPSSEETNTTSSSNKPSDQNKQAQSTLQSPLSSRKVGNGSVTPQFSRPKRARLTNEMESKKPSLDDLKRREAELEREIAELQSENLSLEELDRQMDLLHRYNDIKDAAQVVMGRLAELENVTVKVLHEKYEAPLGN